MAHTSEPNTKAENRKLFYIHKQMAKLASSNIINRKFRFLANIHDFVDSEIENSGRQRISINEHLFVNSRPRE